MTPPAHRYLLLVGPEVGNQLDAAPEQFRGGLRIVLPTLLATLLPGQSELDARLVAGWIPDTYTVPVAGDGWLTYHVDQQRRTVTLLDLAWI